MLTIGQVVKVKAGLHDLKPGSLGVILHGLPGRREYYWIIGTCECGKIRHQILRRAEVIPTDDPCPSIIIEEEERIKHAA